MIVHPRRRKKIVRQRGDVSWKMAQLMQPLSQTPIHLQGEVEGGAGVGLEEASPEVQILGEAEAEEGERVEVHVGVLVQEAAEVHTEHGDLGHEVVEVASPKLLQDLQITQRRRSKKKRSRGEQRQPMAGTRVSRDPRIAILLTPP